MINFRFAALAAVMLTYLGCASEQHPKTSLISENKDDGQTTYKLFYNDSSEFEVTIDSNGCIVAIANQIPEDRIQYLRFRSNGIIESKILLNSEYSGNGPAYYFHTNSGYLSSVYYYKNGTITGTALSYHDSSSLVKEIMEYNDYGEMYYRETVDRNGNTIKIEGSR